MIKKLFTIEELKKYGFTQVTEGGFRYYLLESPSGHTLVSGDFEDNGEDIPDEEFTRVYELPDLSKQLSQREVEDIIYGGGQQ